MVEGKAIRRVAVIGAGPAGIISIDALVQEKAFDVVRVFERRCEAGGCWSADAGPPPKIHDVHSLGTRTADKPLKVPERLPAYTPKFSQIRFHEATVYPYLETNVDHRAMKFEDEPIPDEVTGLSVSIYGPNTPFRHWGVIQGYLKGLLQRHDYEDLVSYNTCVELVEKVGDEWRVVLRKEGKVREYWWEERFDAAVVASGHYSVPYVPQTAGLNEWVRTRPGSILHSKHFRGRDQFKDKRVVVVGKSVSAADIAVDLTSVALKPVHAITIGHTANGYFGDEAFNHPDILNHPSIQRVDPSTGTVHLLDGTTIPNIDHIIFGTGYTWTLPFLPSLPTRNNRIPNLYLHVIHTSDPTLLFIGAVQAGLTFKIFQWQAVLAARLLAGRAKPLPSLQHMQDWEEERIKLKGDGPKFGLVWPDFEGYFEAVRALAGTEGPGRKLPRWRGEWMEVFMEGRELRKGFWRRLNEEARKRKGKGEVRAVL
ncbi:hypothetical protein M409DRAFT_21271 [Zasmidium cellare ATCC 36951]|uniref:FAD/NAD(P)-binding domain-containing protein n=1 Tax=Zasmidium cellare ATCC 36951 TaxID=1080233 RepID=A0A6A6CNA1_ZASCE|nr:uncharacterized protein M409DRAFT_21271 [Zasmidium cellare ATCC 36951]KAF2168521.1 hypothetical protein M409DRAFT_21271 [Zasmidium cellare ATCC 36951]